MEVNRNELDDYFMLPYFHKDIGNIYPVNIFEYERFKMLVIKYIVPDNKMMFDLYKIPQETDLFIYYIESAKQFDNKLKELYKLSKHIPDSQEEIEQLNNIKLLINQYESGELLCYSIKEFEELLSIILKKKILFSEDYFTDEQHSICINKDNFNELRDVVMWQNILFVMPTSPTKIGNKLIQQAIKSEMSGDGSNLSSICSVVSCNSGISNEELKKYTYYRLLYDFSIINKQHGNIFSFMLRSQGCAEAKINNLDASIDLHTNPYDSLFKKHKHDSGKM
ncbi:hypothetical protein [Clostridium sp. M14]|uniref:hypothetical protein n=1 Tax=Clostridium sp. M14 TaxID=2716311 RepID=UPI0013EEE697|nr:hypothetical protein [Clostridium sp. M14]MBZ9693192.1 hypothetical protein [Clostridium sp. M14]